MARRKWSWTTLQNDRANKVIKVVNELEDYWPLTLRQIYYQLVAGGHIDNTRSEYNMLSKLVKWMRIDDKLPWEVLEDRTRTITDKKGFANLGTFIDQELEYFLEGYSRCLVQDQNNYIEVWTEKDALFRIFWDVVYPYCMRAVVCRGYQSITFIADFYKRASEAIMKGQKPIILYFGDLDPSGVQMFEATIETLEDEMGLYGVEYKRVGLNPEHVKLYQLPHDPTAAKMTDPRYHRYVHKYGKLAVELDALHPAQLQAMIRSAIEAEIDMDLFEDQQIEEKQDIYLVKELRENIMSIIHAEIGMFD
jgi:hypothetical protein